jgi:hypothetical protein
MAKTSPGWIVGTSLQLDAVELDLQRCPAHASPRYRMWCLPEWEALDVCKHRAFLVRQHHRIQLRLGTATPYSYRRTTDSANWGQGPLCAGKIG